MNDFRANPPIEQTVSATVSKYQDHKLTLKKNFRGRCGYCDDSDIWRNTYYEVDHFIPKRYLTEAEKREYWNLVYSCRFCNNSKRAKWPTNNRSIANDGRKGFVNPYSTDYDLLFKRDDEGRIIPQTDLAKWMYKNLNLGLKRHSLIWQLEKIDSILDLLEDHFDKIKIKNTQRKVTKLLFQWRRIIKNLQKADD